jgi:transposase
VWRPWPAPSRTSASRLKKVRTAAERDEQARTAWWDDAQTWDPADLIFVDETGTQVGMTPLRGRAPRGERVVEAVARNRGCNTSMVAALSVAGIDAALTIEGAIDRTVFTVFVRDLLVPQLRPGQRVIWDNLSIHRNAEVRAMIAAAGCTLHPLPAYSPDFNPIELAFSKLKTLLRCAAARTRAALDAAITAALPQLTAADARAWVRHCGYGQTGQSL